MMMIPKWLKMAIVLVSTATMSGVALNLIGFAYLEPFSVNFNAFFIATMLFGMNAWICAKIDDGVIWDSAHSARSPSHGASP